MPLTREEVQDVVDRYLRAWREQSPDQIVEVFTDSAIYEERPFEKPILGCEGIRRYWQKKVVESQAEIECKLLSLYLDGDTAIVEWEAEFHDLDEGHLKRMREVAILEFHGNLITHLREYWSSERIGPLDARRNGASQQSTASAGETAAQQSPIADDTEARATDMEP